jgi:ureidoglycolate hydrolase
MGDQERRVAQPLTARAWEPFGWLPLADTDPADGDHRLAFEWSDPHVNIIGHTLEEIPHRDGTLRCEQLFRHVTHTQTIMSIDHPCLITVAPPATDFTVEHSTRSIAVFALAPLEAVVLHRGTWHWGPYPTASEEVRLFNVQGLRYAEDNESVDLGALGLAIEVGVEA